MRMPDPYLPALEPDIDLELLPLDKQAFDVSFSAEKAVIGYRNSIPTTSRTLRPPRRPPVAQ